MKKQILLILSLILGTASFDFAQVTKTVTNADLEKFRQKRLAAEKDYRENYEKRGMPSPEELERREAERQKQLAEYAEQSRARQSQNENSFQARANELRTQLAAIDAQINYLRAQTGSSYNQASAFVGGQISSSLIYGGGISYGDYAGGNYYSRRGGYRQQTAPLAPNVQIVRNAANSFPTAGDIRSQIYGIPPQQVYNRGMRGNRNFYTGGYAAPVIVGNYGQNDFSFQLNSLEQTKAGLIAQWNSLEEEARRASVRIY